MNNYIKNRIKTQKFLITLLVLMTLPVLVNLVILTFIGLTKGDKNEVADQTGESKPKSKGEIMFGDRYVDLQELRKMSYLGPEDAEIKVIVYSDFANPLSANATYAAKSLIIQNLSIQMIRT